MAALRDEILHALYATPLPTVGRVVDRITAIAGSPGALGRVVDQKDFDSILKKLTSRSLVRYLKTKGYTYYNDINDLLLRPPMAQDHPPDNPASDADLPNKEGQSNYTSVRDHQGGHSETLGLEDIIKYACPERHQEVLAYVDNLARDVPSDRELQEADLVSILKKLPARRVIKALKSRGFLHYGDIRASQAQNAERDGGGSGPKGTYSEDQLSQTTTDELIKSGKRRHHQALGSGSILSTRVETAPLSNSGISCASEIQPKVYRKTSPTRGRGTLNQAQGIGRPQAMDDIRYPFQEKTVRVEDDNGHATSSEDNPEHVDQPLQTRNIIAELVSDSGILESFPSTAALQDASPEGNSAIVMLSSQIADIACSADCPEERVLDGKDFHPVLKKLKARRLISYFEQKGFKRYRDFRCGTSYVQNVAVTRHGPTMDAIKKDVAEGLGTDLVHRIRKADDICSRPDSTRKIQRDVTLLEEVVSQACPVGFQEVLCRMLTVADSPDCPNNRQLKEEDFEPVLKKMKARRVISYLKTRGYTCYGDIRESLKHSSEENDSREENDSCEENDSSVCSYGESLDTPQSSTIAEEERFLNKSFDENTSVADNSDSHENHSPSEHIRGRVEKPWSPSVECTDPQTVNYNYPKRDKPEISKPDGEEANEYGEENKADFEEYLNQLKEQVALRCTQEQRDRFQGIYDSLMQGISEQTNLEIVAHSTLDGQSDSAGHGPETAAKWVSPDCAGEAGQSAEGLEDVSDRDLDSSVMDDGQKHYEIHRTLMDIQCMTGAMSDDVRKLVHFLIESGLPHSTHRQETGKGIEGISIESILNRHMPELLRTIDVNPLFRAHLVKEEVFLNQQLDVIKILNKHEQVEWILKYLATAATYDQFEKFICALKDTHQLHPAKLLREEVDSAVARLSEDWYYSTSYRMDTGPTYLDQSTEPKDNKGQNIFKRLIQAIRATFKSKANVSDS